MLRGLPLRDPAEQRAHAAAGTRPRLPAAATHEDAQNHPRPLIFYHCVIQIYDILRHF